MIRAFLMILIVVLSGCMAGGVLTPSPTETPTPTATPSPTPTATATPLPPPSKLDDRSTNYENCRHRADLTGADVTVPYYVCGKVVHEGEEVGGLAYGPDFGDSFHMIIVSQQWVDVGGETMAILHELGHSVFGFGHHYTSVMVHDPAYAPCTIHSRTKRIVEAFDRYFRIEDDGACEVVVSNRFGRYPAGYLR